MVKKSWEKKEEEKSVDEKKVEETNEKTKEGSKRKAEEEKVKEASPENNSLFIPLSNTKHVICVDIEQTVKTRISTNT